MVTYSDGCVFVSSCLNLNTLLRLLTSLIIGLPDRYMFTISSWRYFKLKDTEVQGKISSLERDISFIEVFKGDPTT